MSCVLLYLHGHCQITKVNANIVDDLKRISVSHKPQLSSPKGLHYRGQVLEFLITIFLSVTAVAVVILTLLYYQAFPFVSSNYTQVTEGISFMKFFILALAIVLVPSAVVSWFLLRVSGRQKILKERVEFYAQLFAATTDSIMVHDLSGKCIYANERACRFYGLSEEELLKLNFSELNALGHVENVEAKLAELIDKGQLTYESVHICNGKNETPVEISSLIINSGGRKLIVRAVCDISERKRTAEELKQTSLRLQRAIEGAINAVALTTEIRDPYTAGHQHRVAKLACSIGRRARTFGKTDRRGAGSRNVA